MEGVRQRVLDATGRCAMKYSLQRTTVEDIATESGVSRATIYRHFPNGRDEIVSSTVAHHVDQFFLGLADDVAMERSFEEILVVGLMSASRRLKHNQLFHRLLDVEPEIVLPFLTTESHRILEVIILFLHPFAEVDSPGATRAQIDERCDYVARLFLSYLEAPGSWDLTDEDQVATLVATQFGGR